MEMTFLHREVSDLCLGKPALKSLSISASVGEALSALRNCEESFLSVWNCDHNSAGKKDTTGECNCRCVGKICMVDIICFLCKEDNLLSPSVALEAKVSSLLPEIPGLVMHVEPYSSLIEAIDLILEGTQNLVVPIQNKLSRRKQYFQKRTLTQNARPTTMHNGHEFCWLTQEDIVQYLLSCIGLFPSIASQSISTLGLINEDISAVHYNSPAMSAAGKISKSLFDQTSVAVVDDHQTLIGEISPYTLACCDEAVAAAIATLSTGELMAYIDCGGPPEYIVQIVKDRLKEKNLNKMLEEFTMFDNSSDIFNNFSSSGSSSSSSSDEETTMSSVMTCRSRRFRRSMSYSARMVRRAEAIVCHPGSSLVAVMIQAIAHRVNYVWVIEDDCNLVGIVTFVDVLRVFRDHLQEMV